jgi:3-oxoacyl-[acyl-carrier protein] reductase
MVQRAAGEGEETVVTTPSRTVLVTGAGSGIGAAICRRLAASGTNLLVHTGSKRERAEKVAAECEAKGALCRVETGDLADRETPRRLVAAAVDRFGGLDALIANAGFADKRPLGTLDDDGFARSLAVITTGFFRLADAARPHLLAATSGRIVAVSSFVAHVFRFDGEGFPASAAAKAGLEGLARSLAAQFAPSGVTVNCVVPGYVRKDEGAHAALDQSGWQRAIARVPLGRLALPDEIAATVAFLIGPDAAYITGQSIHVDGGLTL